MSDSLKQTFGDVRREEDAVFIEDVPMDDWGQEKQVGKIMEGLQSLSDQEEGGLYVIVGKENDYLSEEGNSGVKNRDGKDGLSATRSTKRVITRPSKLKL